MPVWEAKQDMTTKTKVKLKGTGDSLYVKTRVWWWWIRGRAQCRCGSQTTSRQQGIGGLLEVEEVEVGDREKSQEKREEGEENIEKPRQHTTKRLLTSKLETPVKEIKKRSRCSVAALRQARLALSVQCSVRAPVPRWI
jgi:hypothetical protein